MKLSLLVLSIGIGGSGSSGYASASSSPAQAVAVPVLSRVSGPNIELEKLRSRLEDAVIRVEARIAKLKETKDDQSDPYSDERALVDEAYTKLEAETALFKKAGSVEDARLRNFLIVASLSIKLDQSQSAAELIAELRSKHPQSVAKTIRSLSAEHRTVLTQALNRRDREIEEGNGG